MRNSFKGALKLLAVAFSVLLLTACGSSGSNYKKLEDKEAILGALQETMNHNEGRCLFYVDSESLIDANAWLNELSGIKNINCEYTRSGKGYNVTAALTYWDNYPIVYAYKNKDESYLTDKQKELLNEYIRVIDSVDAQAGENKKSSIEDKILMIHDYMVENISYDTSLDYVFNAYDALLGHRAICSGYAEVFKTFMDMMGVECITIGGTAGGENHMWNMVQLDNEWYHVDVTWDDPLGNSDGDIYHVYFNIDDAAMGVDHQWDSSKYPKAEGEKYSFYNIQGIKLLNSQEELDEFVAELVENRTKTAEVLVYGKSDIREAFGKLSGRIFSYSYSKTDRKTYVIYSLKMKY